MLAHHAARRLALSLLASPLLAFALDLVLAGSAAACTGGSGFPWRR